jgi:hypothetical protein
MAGKMTGAKGMGAAKMKHKAPPALSIPHKNPRSAHIREANGGYIASLHGGDGDPMGQDHVAPDMATVMQKLQAHMGSGEEGGEAPTSDPMAEEAPEMMPAEAAPKAPPKKADKKKPGKKHAPKIKLRDKSETY